MKLNKEIRAFIREYVSDRPDVNVAELAEIIEMHADKPDAVALLKQEYLRTARRILSTYRDEKGVRTVLALDDGHGKFVNIEKSNNISDLDKISAQLAVKLKGIETTAKKVSQRRAIVAGQIGMEEIFTGGGSSYQAASQ